jgi:hypothetical protein
VYASHNISRPIKSRTVNGRYTSMSKYGENLEMLVNTGFVAHVLA